jgi:outer membrane protein assembly factor BamC
MMRRTATTHRASRRPVLALCVLTALASACTTVEQVAGERKVDYRSDSGKTTGLDVPPDLTQLSRDGRFQPRTDGSVSASTVVAPPAAGPVSAGPVAPSALGEFRVERQGQQRWLVTSRSAEQLWEPIKAFWVERGFTLEIDNAQTGVMETGWAENRAKIPEDFIRRTIGRAFDGLYSTGERDRFRTRLERTADGGTEIFISHRGAEEVYTSAVQDRTGWQPRASDPQLEAEFLSKLMARLGVSEAGAREAVVRAPERPAPERAATVSGAATLQLQEGFDRAWRRVGLALDRQGFTVEDRDRAAGLYFVRYIDPVALAASQREPGLLDRVLGRKAEARIERYRVLVKSDGANTIVSLQNGQGAAEAGETARRILEQLASDLR